MNAHAVARPGFDDGFPADLASGAVFDVPDEELEAHPLVWIERLRRVTPVWCRKLRVRNDAHPDLYGVLTRSRLGGGAAPGHNGMLTSNGEVHRRRRRPLARPFAMRAIEALRSEIAVLVRDMFADLARTPVFEVSQGFARDVPGAILCRVMSVPEQDVAQVNDWVHTASECLGAFQTDQVPRIEDAATQLLDYSQALLTDARTKGVGGFLGDFLSAAAATDEYSEVEAYVQFAGTIMAAAETTRVSITMACSACCWSIRNNGDA